MTNLTKVKYIISEKLNKLYAKKLRLNEQGGSWPGFQNWAVGINSILMNHQNPCNFLAKTYDKLYNKLMSLGGGTGIPNTPAGQAQLAMLTAKLTYLAAWIQYACQMGVTACCSIRTPVTEQVLQQIPQEILSQVDPALISQAQQAAKDSVQQYVSQNN